MSEEDDEEDEEVGTLTIFVFFNIRVFMLTCEKV